MTERPSMLDTLIGMNELMARRSTCSRAQIAASAVVENRIVATGYVGAPQGMPHCEHLEWRIPQVGDGTPPPRWVRDWFVQAGDSLSTPMRGMTYRRDSDGRGHVQNSIQYDTDDPANAPTCLASVHAEANLIAFAAAEGIRLRGAKVIVSQSPCLACAKLLINAKISKVIAVKMYRDPAGVDLLRDAMIDVVTP